MRTDTKYLEVSANGWYTYIRRIPRKLNDLPELAKHKTFYKKSLNTKDRVLAELETGKLNTWFDQLKGNAVKPTITKDKIRRVKDELRIRDLVKQSVPVEEIDDYVVDKMNKEAFWDALLQAEAKHQDWDTNGLVIDDFEYPEFQSASFDREDRRQWEIERLTEALADKYDDGKGGYLKPDPYDDDVIKLRMLKGDLDIPLEPTFGDAIQCKINDYLENKDATESQRHHYPSQLRSIADKIASGLPKGLQTPLSELDRDEIKTIAEKIWPNASTRNTNMSGRMVSVISTWNKRNPKHKLDDNPFSGLVGQKSIKKDTKTRRSVTPEEWSAFWTNLEGCDDPEIKLIGMMIAYCGCPQSETASMLRADLKLQDNVPHVIIRRNLKGGSRLARCVPLVGSILDHWRDYAKNHFIGTSHEDPLFPKYGTGIYQVSARAKKLAPMVKKISDQGEDILSSYSQRHSFKDRYRAAGVTEGVGSYLMGHRNKQSSKVHEDYGGVRHPEKLLDDMIKITQVQRFGYQEKFDEL